MPTGVDFSAARTGSNNKCLGKSALVNRNAFGLTGIISLQEE